MTTKAAPKAGDVVTIPPPEGEDGTPERFLVVNVDHDHEHGAIAELLPIPSTATVRRFVGDLG